MGSATDDPRGLNLASGEEDTEENVAADDGESTEDEDDGTDDRVLLGFLTDADDDDESTEDNEPDDGSEEELHRRRRFPVPGKAGGATAWLDPVNLPAGDARLCGFCGEPLRFVLQVYAPLPPVDGEDEDAAYHRALFVFMCPAMPCLLLDQREQLAEVNGAGGRRRRSVRVFRSQLPWENPFYRYDHDDNAGVEAAPLCAWCGKWPAETACAGGCDTAAAAAASSMLFCSDKHLKRYLRSGHANGDGCGEHAAPSASSATWPEYAMVSEEERIPSTAPQEQGGGDGAGNDQHLCAAAAAAAADDDDESEAEAAAVDDDDDESEPEAAAVDDALMAAFEAAADEDAARWASFLARVSPEPEQVLRYSAGGRPLWAAASGSLAGPGAPACRRCGGARRYEMQLMPQLLHYFHVEARDPDPLDWATVAIYTCAGSCGGGGYVEEFAWVQPHAPGMKA